MLAALFVVLLVSDPTSTPAVPAAYVAPRRPALPTVARADWPRNPIDHFVLARLERENLEPAVEASRERLIRRLSLDLIGLPPTPEQVDAFLADSSTDAYERVVDRLLASPRFGERLARPWLDLARFADTNGYEKDLPRNSWPWRDWVIRAFNDDLPFDRFSIEQIAGDLLPNPTVDQSIATGFHRNTLLNDEGGADPEEFRVAAVIDRVHTTATIWLGSTIACAQCHDHKYDPISQREFFGLYAFFDQTEDAGVGAAPEIEVPTQAEQAQRIALDEKIAAVRAEVAASAPSAEARALTAATRALLERSEPADLLFHDSLDSGTEEGVLGNATRFGDGAETARNEGPRLSSDRPFSYGAFFKVTGSGAIVGRIDPAAAYRGFDLYCDANRLQVHLIHHWPDNGIKIETIDPIDPSTWHHAFVTWDGSGKAAGLTLWLDGERTPTRIASDTLVGSIDAEVPFRVGSREGQGGFVGLLDDVRVYDRALDASEVAQLAFAPLRAVLNDREASRAGRIAELRRLEDERAKFQVTRTMVMRDRKDARETRLQKRGDFRTPGEVITPFTPAALHGFDPSWPRNRLGLAFWLVDPRNPLLGRAWANRAWEMLFGAGLVATPEDFGNQSEPPSHPELLDWLAVEFVDCGMSTKAMLRLIVTSATYRQAAEVDAAKYEADPRNTWLARGARFRLEHEAIRDNALAIGGLLDARIGGPSVMPQQPAGVWADSFANFDTPQYQWKDAEGLDRYRRGIYTYLRRSAIYPSALTFDAPRRDVCVVARSRTNTPLQSLTVLNDPVFVEAAGGLARRIMATATGDARRLDLAFRICLARSPTSTESARLLALLAESRVAFEANPEAARQWLAVARARRVEVPSTAAEDAELAAWTVIGNTLLNLDETVTRG